VQTYGEIFRQHSRGALYLRSVRPSKTVFQGVRCHPRPCISLKLRLTSGSTPTRFRHFFDRCGIFFLQRRLVYFSRVSSCALVSSPPAKPVSFPDDPMTRWQGTMIDTGFLPFAAPTARVARGLPSCFASWP